MTTPLKARDILTMSEDDLWSVHDNTQYITLVFDDGSLVKTTGRRTIFCYYLWDVHRQYDVALLPTHHMGNEWLTGKTHLNILGEVYKTWFQAYRNTDVALQREDVWRMMYEMTNRLYNAIITRLGAYVATLSITDFVEVISNTEVTEANRKMQPNQGSIDETYDKIIGTLKTSDELKANNIARAVRCSLVDNKQVLQCVSARGYVTDVDSRIFKQPIAVGFAKGMRSFYDSLIESRSASKALMFAKNPLQDCEYFNRKMQLVAQVVDILAPGDCGSTAYMHWRVEPSELERMEGMHYVDNGELKTIQKGDLHLEGQTLMLRTPFGCAHPDRQTVCETCFGETAYSIPFNTSLGHVSSTAIGEKISQLVLSTKHVDGSSEVDDIYLGEIYSKYLIAGSGESVLRLNPELKGQRIRLTVSADEAKGLPQVEKLPNLEDANIYRITELREVLFQIGDPEDETTLKEIAVPTSMGSRYGSFTAEALQYIVQSGFTVNDRGDYVVDLMDWDIRTALFQLPLKHQNMLDYQNQVEKVLFSRDKTDGMKTFSDPVMAIKSLFALISSRLTINLSHVLVMAYSVAARDPDHYDYTLPRNGEAFKFVSMDDLVAGRSLSASMAYQRQDDVIRKIYTYTHTDRLRHSMDSLLMG